VLSLHVVRLPCFLFFPQRTGRASPLRRFQSLQATQRLRISLFSFFMNLLSFGAPGRDRQGTRFFFADPPSYAPFCGEMLFPAQPDLSFESGSDPIVFSIHFRVVFLELPLQSLFGVFFFFVPFSVAIFFFYFAKTRTILSPFSLLSARGFFFFKDLRWLIKTFNIVNRTLFLRQGRGRPGAFRTRLPSLLLPFFFC